MPFAATSVYARYFLVSSLTSLDVGGTRLDDTGMETIATWTPWLRELMAAGVNKAARQTILDDVLLYTKYFVVPAPVYLIPNREV